MFIVSFALQPYLDLKLLSKGQFYSKCAKIAHWSVYCATSDNTAQKVTQAKTQGHKQQQQQ